RIGVDVDEKTVSQQSVFFASPRFMHLPKSKVRTSIHLSSAATATITFRSPVFQHAVAFDLPGLPHRSDDNYFDLYPDEPRQIALRFDRTVTRKTILGTLRLTTLA